MALGYKITANIPSMIVEIALIVFLINVVMYLHECFHGIAYKIIDENADIVINMKGCIKSVWNKSNTWYDKQQIIFVLLLPLGLSGVLFLLGALIGLIWKSFIITGYLLAVLNIAGMLLDFGHTISILFDSKHKAFKYDKDAKLLRY